MFSRWFKSLRLASRRRPPRQRIARSFDCAWLSARGPRRARVSSLSPTGCYIEDRSTVPPDGDAIPELTVVLPTGHICVQGTVTGAKPGVGFAVRFTNIDPDTRAQLIGVVQHHRQRTAI